MWFVGGYLKVYEDVGSVTLCAVSRAEVEFRAFIEDIDYYYFYYEYHRDHKAADGEDYVFPNHNFTAEPFYNFTMFPGRARCFEIAIIDDNIAEYQYEWIHYSLGIYRPFPVSCFKGRIRIYDNDGEL